MIRTIRSFSFTSSRFCRLEASGVTSAFFRLALHCDSTLSSGADLAIVSKRIAIEIVAVHDLG